MNTPFCIKDMWLRIYDTEYRTYRYSILYEYMTLHKGYVMKDIGYEIQNI